MQIYKKDVQIGLVNFSFLFDYNPVNLIEEKRLVMYYIVYVGTITNQVYTGHVGANELANDSTKVIKEVVENFEKNIVPTLYK